MKKQITRLGFSVLMIAAIAFTAAAQPEKKNDKKEQQQNRANKKNKEAKAGIANSGKNNSNVHAADKQNQQDQEGRNDAKDNQAKHEGRDNKRKHEGQDNKEKHDAINNKEKNNDMSHGNRDMEDGYKWNHETFKDRKKYKNGKKVTICHKFKRDNEPAVTITVSAHALKAHMNHGDVMGDCPAVANNRFSDIFLRKRKDYYNNIQNSDEQVSYSRSILDYALVRLTDSRQQLATAKNNKMPVADIERKQATVAQLEQNVSLLETLIGVATELLVNKL
jgi:hypothetical protein